MGNDLWSAPLNRYVENMAKSFPRSYRIRRRNAWLKFVAFILAVAILSLGIAAYILRNEHPVAERIMQ
jgi:hypothetical protein